MQEGKGGGGKEKGEKIFAPSEKKICHVSRVVINVITLDLLNPQDTQKERNMTYVQPYMWKIRDISRLTPLKRVFCEERFLERSPDGSWLVGLLM